MFPVPRQSSPARAVLPIVGTLFMAVVAVSPLAAQPFGGVVGVLETTTFQPDAQSMRMSNMVRAMTVEQQQLLDPVATTEQFIGRVTVWVDRPDRRYVAGEAARVFLSADHGAYVQLLTVSPNGASEWLYPAEKAVQSREAPWIAPERVVALPRSDDGFVYRMAPPAGSSVLYAIASSQPLPASERQALAHEIDEAGKGRVPGGVRAAVVRFAERHPEWRMRTEALPYEIVDRPGAPPVTPVALQGPPAVPSPTTTQAPALAWLRPTASSRPSLTVHLDSQSYSQGGKITISIRSEVGCNALVLALGSGGGVDLLYPNLRQPDPLWRAGTDATVPSLGSDLTMRVRGVVGAGWREERIVAICVPLDQPALTARKPDNSAPTLSFAAGSPELAALEALRERSSTLIVAEAMYRISGEPSP